MNLNYKTIRHAYYIGIFLLVAYALPQISFIKDFVYPVLNWEPVVGLPIISFVGILTGIGAFAAYRYRKIG